jgi:hypothetical protein
MNFPHTLSPTCLIPQGNRRAPFKEKTWHWKEVVLPIVERSIEFIDRLNDLELSRVPINDWCKLPDRLEE